MDVERFIEIMEALGEGVGRARSYSGRGMSGRECLGVSTTYDEIGLLYEMSGECDDAELRELLDMFADDARIEALGQRNIIYFPRTEWPEDDGVTAEGTDEDEDD